MDSFLYPIIGGALIGLASIGLLLFNGRIAGISGIFSGVLGRISTDGLWKVAFVAGLLAGGLVLRLVFPQAFDSTLVRSLPAVLAAGFLVGFGTRLGSGCTSGHGVCGLSRFSPRSLVAVLTFMAAGVAVVFVVSRVFGGVL